MRPVRSWAHLWSRLNAVSLRVKIMGIVMTCVFLLGVGVTWQIRVTLGRSLSEQLDQRAVSIARDVAARSTDLILTNNIYALYELARSAMENNPEVRYIFFLDPQGRLMVHTFGGGFPAGLLEANPLARQGYSLELLDTEEGPVRDVAVPIFEGRAGVVHLGLLETFLHRQMATVTEQLLLATLAASLLGVLAAYLLSGVLARPVHELVATARRVTDGDLSARARIWARDEIGHLSDAFNRMVEELGRKEQIRSQLLEKAIAAQEEERKRIARELHDETSQSLTSLMVGLKVLEEAPTLEAVRRGASELRALAAKTLKEVHHLAVELRPSVLDDLGLVAAVQRQVLDIQEKTGLEVDLHVGGMEEHRLPLAVETALYRIIQEALTNVARHSRARNVSVVLEQRDSTVVAIVEDDGQGFHVDRVFSTRGEERCLGLYGMHERASLVGGMLAVESSPGVGTTVFVQVPLPAVKGGLALGSHQGIAG